VRRSRLLALGVALAALVAYGGTLLHGFVWDDVVLIQRSYNLHDWSALPAALGTHFWAESQERSLYYRPFITLTFFLDLKLWGLNPFGFHLTNVLAHLVTSLGVLWLARRLTRDDVAGFAAGALFAVHPLHTESVAFISGRTDIFATLFVLLALLGYARWRAGERLATYAASLAMFALALASKEVAVTLPLILALYDWGRGDLRTRRALASALPRYAPYGLVFGLYCVARLAVIGQGALPDATTLHGLTSRVLTTLEIAGWYVALTVVPYPLNAYYWIEPVTLPPDPSWWLAVLALGAGLALTVLAAQRAPKVAVGALWFWITLVPFTAINLLPLANLIMAERFLYLPTVGFCLVLGMGVSRLVGAVDLGRSAQLRPGPALGFTALLLCYVLLGLWRNEDWKDDYRLFLKTVETSPNAPLPWINLAFTQIPRGEIEAAHGHLKKAVELDPGNPRALVGLGLTETILGDRQAGLEHALDGHARAGRDANLLAALGTIFLFRGEPARAVPYLEQSLAINPNQVITLLNQALALAKLDRQGEAESVLARATTLARLMSPDNPLTDRITAEVYATRDPQRAATAWERYIARLRGVADPPAFHRADLAYAEVQLRRLREASR
jgi:Tfp pilus assembly protein PilF